MSNIIQFSINGDTNAEQVTARAKTAVSGFDKQVEGIGKKFAGSFKDIFLSFLGPMALLGAAIGFIGKLIADNQKKHDDANQAAIDGTNKLMSSEDKYWANKMDKEKKAKEAKEQAKTTREDITQSFLENDPRGKKILKEEREKLLYGPLGASYQADKMAERKDIQDRVQAILNPEAKGFVSGKDTTFQAPSGFSNVIGVGANPVLENLTRQTQIQEEILEYIKQSQPTLGGTDIDFTKFNPALKYTS
jgi:hypothetical protein